MNDIHDTNTHSAAEKTAAELKLYGLLAHWDELGHPLPDWVVQLLNWEEDRRQKRACSGASVMQKSARSNHWLTSTGTGQNNSIRLPCYL